MNKHLLKKSLTMMLALMLVLSSVMPAWADGPYAEQLPDEHVGLSSEKIAEDVRLDMATEEDVEVFVYLDDSLNVESFAQQARQKHASVLTDPVDLRLQVRRDLTIALQDTAHLAQANVLNLLATDENVTEYESFWVANVVYVKAAPSVIERIARLPEVLKIEKNKTHQLDPIIETQAAEPQEEELLWHLSMVKADQVWNLGFDGTGAVVGLIDSGVQWDHPALKNAWRGYNEETGETTSAGNWLDTVANEPLPVDSDSHGTHVTGTMVGYDPATDYHIGVAPGAKFIAARVFNELGSTTDAQLLRAGQWMVAPDGNPDMAPDVVNNSWGGGNQMDEWYRDTVRAWVAAEIFPTVSAGNQRTGEPLPGPGSVTNPAYYPEAFAVGAIDRDEIRAPWSKRGPSVYGDETVAGWKPNISAPGVSIMSAYPGGTYRLNSGTSMSAPHVSGVIALMRSSNYAITLEEMYDAIYETAKPLIDNNPYDFSPNHDYGYGLIDAMEAVSSVAGGSGFFAGQVLQSGEDTVEPVIEHTQTYTDIYVGSHLVVEATITDDISVVKAAVEVQSGDETTWTEVPMTLISGDHTGGDYRAVIPPTLMTGDVLKYRIKAIDFGGHEVLDGPYTVNLDFGIVPGDYMESFESDSLGWTFETPWETGAPVLETEPTPVNGDNVLATVLGGPYTADLSSVAISPPIDMRNTTEASLRFFHWHQFGVATTPIDYGRLYLSNDFGETMVEVNTYAGNTTGWEGVVVDLSGFAQSETPVFAYYELTTSPYTHYLGWYIDQVTVEGKDEAAPSVPNVTVNGSLHGVRISWDRVPEADLEEYIVYRADSATGDMVELARTKQTYYEDRTVESDQTFYYAVSAIDIFGNESDQSPRQIGTRPPSTTVAFYDFEADDGGFTLGYESPATGNDWEWGDVDPAYGPKVTDDEGTKLWATNIAGPYSANRRSWVATPTISVPTTGASYLTFDHWHWFEQATSGRKWDWGQIQINVPAEGDEWTNITPPDQYDIDNGEPGSIGGPNLEADAAWSTMEILLDPAYNGKDVQFRFYHSSDGSLHRAGWYIDNVSVINLSAPASVAEREIVPTSTIFNSGSISSIDMDAFVPVPQQTEDPAGIPIVGARVSVVETGTSVRTNPATGEYLMRHRITEGDEEWTLKAEAYGFKPDYFSSTLDEDQTVRHVFLLEPEDSGRITGRVFDRYYGDPAVGAIVRIVEDPNVAPVVTDEEGRFTFEKVYVGDYTLHVVGDGFEPGTAEVTVVKDETAHVEIGLKRFIGMPGDLIYDEDDPSNALVLNNAGNGLAVRFTPEQYGKVLATSVYFWDTSWPTPGGTEIGFGIFEVTGADPTMNFRQVGDTVWRDDIVRGAWNRVDLEEINFSTDGDFYISTIQKYAGQENPGVAIDEAGAADRSYMYLGDAFQLISVEDITGGLMIRAHMMYAVGEPVITNLEAENYVNTDYVDIEGTVNYTDGDVKIYLNGELATTIPSEELVDNTFATRLELTEEVNTIEASMEVDGQETEPSPPITVIVDKIAPDLEVVSPIDGANINVELVHVTGTVQDKYLDTLMINETEVTVEEDGSFATRLIVEPGENIIQVVATDKALNQSEETVTVYVGLDDVEITNMQPAEDVTIQAGESVIVSFNAPSGGTGTYVVAMPIAPAEVELSSIPMTEVSPGYYEGTWIAPEATAISRANVSFRYTDPFGNQATAVAPGTITVVVDPYIEPNIERIAGDNRFATAVEMSQETFETADTVILANGHNFPDALVGGIYAESLQAPVLLVEQDNVPQVVMDEITRLGAHDVKILGGELVVGPNVINQLVNANLTVERVAGANRYTTAIEISRRAKASDSTHVYLVSSQNYPDALGIVPIAARQDHSILLTASNRIDDSTVKALQDWGIESVTVVGGPSVIQLSVVEQLRAMDIRVERIAGDSRYATNIQMVETYYAAPIRAIGASGENFPDALVSTVYAAIHNQPIILVNPAGLDIETRDYLRDSEIREMLLMGGTLTIPAEVELEILRLIQD